VIQGIGLQLVSVAPYSRFLSGRGGVEVEEGWFTKAELEYCRSRGDGGQHLAARHAAKTATLQALGLPGDNALLSQVEVVRGALGRPEIRISPGGVVAARAGGARVHVSLSHSGDHAVAFVVVEAWEEPDEEDKER